METSFELAANILTEPSMEPIRAGFGRGLLKAGATHENVVALCADLSESTQMHHFRDTYPDRFFEVGVAEQNLVTVAAGMAHAGKLPFTSSYAAFSPGRNWEQIKTTSAMNDRAIIVVGSHAGLNVGHDGATHQMLEDIALMRVMPNMRVIVPADSIEAEKATLALANDPAPSYLRLARDATPIISSASSAFTIGPAYVLQTGNDVTVFATGTMTYQALVAAAVLGERGLSVTVVHVPTIKPLDQDTILKQATRTGLVVTIEEAQRVGGLGSAVTEVTSEFAPCPVLRLGVDDRFGESGTPDALLERYELTGPQLADAIAAFVAAAKG